MGEQERIHQRNQDNIINTVAQNSDAEKAVYMLGVDTDSLRSALLAAVEHGRCLIVAGKITKAMKVSQVVMPTNLGEAVYYLLGQMLINVGNHEGDLDWYGRIADDVISMSTRV